MAKKVRTTDNPEFAPGTVWAVPLCDPHEPEPDRRHGLAVLVARTEPFNLKKATLLVYGFPGGDDLNALPDDWFLAPPSNATVVFAATVNEAGWKRVGMIDHARIPYPQFRMPGFDNTWRESHVDPVTVSCKGLFGRITEAQADGRAAAEYVGAATFQYQLHEAIAGGWKWTRPLSAVRRPK